MSSISAGTTTGTALVSTGDTSGVLYLQTNNGVNAVTIAANQYVGIGTTTPAYLLDVAGTTRTTNLTLTNPLGITSGGTGLTSLTANGVLYANSSSALTTGSALTFDGTNLGIGLATPSGYGISPRAYVQQAADSGWKGLVIASAGSDAFIGVYYDGSVFNYSASYGSSAGYKPQAWQVGGSEQMRLTSTGLGIGTSSPQARLNVVDASSANNGTIWLGSATYYGTIKQDSVITGAMLYNVAAAAGGGHQFQVGGTTLMNLVPSGNLGLGVTPSAWNSTQKVIQVGYSASFSANSGSNYCDVGNNINFNSGTKYIQNGYATLYEQNVNGQHTWFVAPSGTAGNAISLTQAMTLNNSGYLGIGTTSPSNPLTVKGSGAANFSYSYSYGASNYGLAIPDSISTNNNLFLSNTSGTATLSSGAYYYGGGIYHTDGTASSQIQLTNSGTVQFYTNSGLTAGSTFTPTLQATLDTSGRLLVGATSIGSQSSTSGYYYDSSGQPIYLSTLAPAGYWYGSLAGTTQRICGFLGYTADPAYGYILLVPAYASSAVNVSIFTGTIYRLRGASYAGLEDYACQITVASGYLSNNASGVNFGTGNWSFVQCTYGGVVYLGIRTTSTAAGSIVVDAIYTNNFTPILVSDSSVSSVTVLSTI